MNRINEDRWAIADIVNMYRPDGTGDISLPPSQRNWAWKGKNGEKKKQLLIDSVMDRYPIPTCILHRFNVRQFHLYDGRHRMETFWLYANDKFAWNGKKYSELSNDDKHKFLSREIPVTIISNVTPDTLVEMFIRLNSGKALRDHDLFWANKDKPLVKAVDKYVVKNSRLSECLSGLKLDKREDLSNWVALVYGLTTHNAGNISTSFIRVCNSGDGGLDCDIDEDIIEDGLSAVCTLLETANCRYPADDQSKQSLKKVGKVLAFFVADWLETTTNKEERSVTEKWVGIIGKLRGSPEEQKLMNAALSVTGAQNLTSEKIKKVIAQVNDYLENNIAAVAAEDYLDDDTTD